VVAVLVWARVTLTASVVAELLSPSGSSPSARAFHTAVVSDAGKMYIFGGENASDLSDIHAYDIGSESWVTVSPGGSTPAARSKHSAVFDDASGVMLVYGGSVGSSNETSAYSAAANQWTDLSPNGAVGAREGHSAVFNNPTRCMWVFGGCRLEAHGSRGAWMVWLSDLSRYDVATNRWTASTPSGEAPAPRAFHTAVPDAGSSSIYVFGGFDAERDADSAFGDLYKYDSVANRWEELTSSIPRYHHAAAFDVGAQKMYVAGGLDGNRTVLSDVQVYDVASRQWTLLTASGPRRWGHSMVLHQQHLYIFGGADAFALREAPKTDTMWRIALLPRKPTKRMRGSHAAENAESGQMHGHNVETNKP